MAASDRLRSGLEREKAIDLSCCRVRRLLLREAELLMHHNHQVFLNTGTTRGNE